MNTHVRLPGEPQEPALYIRTPVTPEEAFQAIGRLRKEARDEIDRLIRFLDKTDDYVSRELEEQVDDGPIDDVELEPSLGGVTAGDDNRSPDCRGEDLEGDDTPTGRSAEDEPILGSVAAGMIESQARWSDGVGDGREGDDCADDREGDELQHGGDEHDGAEPDECREPSLGWTESGRIGNSPLTDGEVGEPARGPQNRTVTDRRPLVAENTYRRFLHGVPDAQAKKLRSRMRPNTAVIVRS